MILGKRLRGQAFWRMKGWINEQRQVYWIVIIGRHLGDKMGTESKKKQTEDRLHYHKGWMLLDDSHKSPPTVHSHSSIHVSIHTPEVRLTGPSVAQKWRITLKIPADLRCIYLVSWNRISCCIIIYMRQSVLRIHITRVCYIAVL